jgi:hypothetical protein
MDRGPFPIITDATRSQKLTHPLNSLQFTIAHQNQQLVLSSLKPLRLALKKIQEHQDYPQLEESRGGGKE